MLETQHSPLKKKADAQQEHIQIEAFMRALKDSEKGEDTGQVPQPPPPPNLDLDYVIETWLQHRIHHTYPEPGGYNDQDVLLMEDWKTLNLWYIRVSRGVVTYNPELMDQVFPDIKQWVHD